jgi:hypothetical protein
MKMKTIWKALATGAVISAAWSAVSAAGVLSPFTAIYQVSREDLSIGHGRFTLKSTGSNCYSYQQTLDPEGIAALLTGRVNADSRFCMVGGKIRPQSYSSSNERDADDNFTLTFEPLKNLVRTNDEAPRDIPPDAMDPLLVQIAIRKMLKESGDDAFKSPVSMTIVDGKRAKDYEFALQGHETVKTKAGSFDTVRVDKLDKRKRQSFWLAPKLDYLIVQVEMQRKEDPVFRMTLESLPDSPAD